MPRSEPKRPRRRWRWLLRIAQTLALSALAWIVWERITFDREHWQADYVQLREHLGATYANLLWAREEGGLDLVALDRRTREALDDAGTDRQARAAIADFLAAFDDGHLRIHRIKLSKRIEAWWAGLGQETGEPIELRSQTPAEAACAALGFGSRDGSFSPELALAEGFSALPGEDNAFEAATLELPGGKRWGLLRIHSFDERAMLPACRRAWPRFAERIDGVCDEDCRDEFSYGAVPDQLLAELTARIEQLQGAGIDALLVDIMHNGGGTDWVDPAARLLTDVPMVCPRLTFIRHPHWSERLRARLGAVERDLEAQMPDADRWLLVDAQARIGRLLEQAEARCDLSGVWTDPTPPACSNLVEAEYYACGVFGYLESDRLASAGTRTLMFEALGYDYTPGVYRGPLIVLVDQRTGSASEYFAAMLQDNDAAVVVGVPTDGSGCGYTNGGVPIVLEHSELRVELPDCQRRRRDGTNELGGITPDHPVGWADDDDASTRARALVSVLDSL